MHHVQGVHSSLLLIADVSTSKKLVWAGLRFKTVSLSQETAVCRATGSGFACYK